MPGSPATSASRPLPASELGLAPDEPAARALRLRLGRGAVESRVLAEDRLFEVAQLAAGFEAELADQGAAGVLVGGQRVGLAPGPVEREHELAAQALAQGVLGDQRLELSDHLCAAKREVGLDPIRQRLQAQLIQASDLGPGERRKGKVGQRRPTPQPERLPEMRGRGRGRARGQRRPARVEVAPNAVEIQSAGLDLQQIAGRPGDEHVASEHLAQRRHIHLHKLGRRRRRSLAPELVDDPVAGHDLVRVEQQQREQCPLLRRPELDLRTVDHRLERAENPELDHLSSDPNRAAAAASTHRRETSASMC
jgi:hypothetical protein